MTTSKKYIVQLGDGTVLAKSMSLSYACVFIQALNDIWFNEPETTFVLKTMPVNESEHSVATSEIGGE